MDSVTILGINIHSLSVDELRNVILGYLDSDKQHQIVTPNPEFCVTAQKDKEFRTILNKASLAIPDGIGLKLSSIFLGKKIKQRITGVELVGEICKIAESKNKNIYLLGAENEVAFKAAQNIKKRYPKINIVGAENEFSIFGKMKDEKVIKIINKRKPDILFVAFGAPKQEKWIYYNLPKLETVKIAVGVGGTFDYLSGKVRYAPKSMRILGLEWLYRFYRQPWRWKRMFNATTIFPINVLIYRNHGKKHR